MMKRCVQKSRKDKRSSIEEVILSIQKADFKKLTYCLKDSSIDFNSIPRGECEGPIHVAVSYPEEKIALSILELLLCIGLDVNLKRINDGSTALHIASSMQYSSIFRVLLDFGADSNITNDKGIIPELKFQEYQSVELSRISMEHLMDLSKDSSLSSMDSSYYSATSQLNLSSSMSLTRKEEIVTYSTPCSSKALVESHSESAANILSSFARDNEEDCLSGTLSRLSISGSDPYESSKDYPSPLNSTTPKNLHKFIKNYKELLEMDMEMNKAFRQLIEDNIELQSSINVLTREGILKSSFNYLLLDSRITQNLPFRTLGLGDQTSWNVFLSSIFYIGKGTRSRPLHHLTAALIDNPKVKRKVSSKIQMIQDIWKSGNGVVNLQVFNNSIAVEALTRESSMIQAIGVDNISNVLKGDVYGVVQEWSPERIREYGTYLLFRAFKIFLVEGERQLKPVDIKPKRIL